MSIANTKWNVSSNGYKTTDTAQFPLTICSQIISAGFAGKTKFNTIDAIYYNILLKFANISLAFC